MLKEYIARGNYIYPPGPTMRLTTDLFAVLPRARAELEHDLDLRLPLPREGLLGGAGGRLHALLGHRLRAGGDRRRGSTVDEFAPRLAFFFNGHNNVFQEVAKFRAARRMWAQIMRERFGATNPKSTMLRFHTQTGGVTLTAQQPQNNIVRVTLQGFAAVCGGTQSLHTNGFDEALALPTERAAKLALRTQQMLAHESGAADTVDPFAGSYFVESLTDEIEARASELIAQVDELGGSVEAIEFITAEIDESAWGYQERYRTSRTSSSASTATRRRTLEVPELLRVDPESEREQVERLTAFKAEPRPGARRAAPRGAARGRARQREPAAPIRQALKDRCSIGEVCGAMREVFGSLRADVLSAPRCSRERSRRSRSRSSSPSRGGRRTPDRNVDCAMVLAVTFYTFVLALHIASIVIAFGVTFAYPVMYAVGLKREARAMPGFHRIQDAVGKFVITPFLALALLCGIYLASKLQSLERLLRAVGLRGDHRARRPRRRVLRAARAQTGELAERDVAAAGDGEVHFSAEYLALRRQVAIVGYIGAVLILLTIFFMTAQTGA